MPYVQQYRDFTVTFPDDVRVGGLLVLVDLKTGEPLYESEVREVAPGETLTLNWTRPSSG